MKFLEFLTRELYISEKAYKYYPVFMAASGTIILGGPLLLRKIIGYLCLIHAIIITIKRMRS